MGGYTRGVMGLDLDRLIDQHCRDNGLTNAEFAQQVGTSMQNVARWRRGQVVPAASIAPQLAAALGVPVEDVFLGMAALRYRHHVEGRPATRVAELRDLQARVDELEAENATLRKAAAVKPSARKPRAR